MKNNRKLNRWIIVLATVFVLVVVNGSIWQKERHLAEGEIVYLELAPVDPRSLIQSDQGELLLVAMYDEALNRLGEMTQ